MITNGIGVVYGRSGSSASSMRARHTPFTHRLISRIDGAIIDRIEIRIGFGTDDARIAAGICVGAHSGIKPSRGIRRRRWLALVTRLRKGSPSSHQSES